MARMFLALCMCGAAGFATPRAEAQTIATAAQVNGTWENKNGEFKIWALGQQMLQIEFSGTHEYKSPVGPMANTGEGHGIASIDGVTAIFKPDGAEDECRITMRFTHGKLIVTQTGFCGFGAGVNAEGTYHKTSSRKPTFESAAQLIWHQLIIEQKKKLVGSVKVSHGYSLINRFARQFSCCGAAK